MTGILIRRSSRTLLLLVALALFAGPAAAQSLYWLDTNYGAPTLNKSDANGLGVVTLPLGSGTLPEGLAVAATGKLYWTEGAWTGARLNRVAPTLASASITPIVTGGSALRGIAVDDVAQMVYWTSSNLITGSSIWRAGLDGSGAATIVTLPIGANPRGIAVDHTSGKIYWADFDLDVIFRANLDGTASLPWMTVPAGSGAYGVAVDPVAGLVYWTEYNNGRVQRATTAGGGLITLVPALSNPTYLALDVAGARMYWTEGGAITHRIGRATTSGGGVITLPPVINTYGGIAYIANGTTSTPGAELPTAFALDRLWPSPSRDGMVHVEFSIPREASGRLSVLDLQGREIAVLADGVLSPGRQERLWNARAHTAPPGIYFVRLAVDRRVWTRRIALIP